MEPTASRVARCIRLAREGRSDALNDLLEAHRNYLRLLATTSLDRSLQGKTGASDVVQEALLEAYAGFTQFRGSTEAEWVGWLRKILANSLADVGHGQELWIRA